MYVRAKSRRVARKRPFRARGRKLMRPRKAKVSMAVANYVKRQIHKQIENKTVSDQNEVDFASYLADIDLKVNSLMPGPSTLSISQGVGQSQRVGNTITTRKLLFKYIIHPNPQQDPTQIQPIPQEVIIWFGYLRNNRLKQPDISDYNQYFQNGNTTQAPSSTLWDMMRPVNADLFHICKTIRHKVGNSVYTDYAGIKPYNYYTNNDFKLNVTRTIDLTKYINKVLKFNDDSLVCDTGLYVWMTAVPADGTLGVQEKVLRMSYIIRYDYEDA